MDKLLYSNEKLENKEKPRKKDMSKEKEEKIVLKKIKSKQRQWLNTKNKLNKLEVELDKLWEKRTKI